MDKKPNLRELARDYWDFIQDVLTALDKGDLTEGRTFAFYGIETKRTQMHDELCEAMGLPKEQTKEITDNIDQCKDFDEFFQKLTDLKGGTK